MLDFSIHGEDGKNPDGKQGPTKKERDARFSENHDGREVAEHIREYNMKKTDKAIKMVKYAIKRGIRFDYLLMTAGLPMPASSV